MRTCLAACALVMLALTPASQAGQGEFGAYRCDTTLPVASVCSATEPARDCPGSSGRSDWGASISSAGASAGVGAKSSCEQRRANYTHDRAFTIAVRHDLASTVLSWKSSEAYTDGETTRSCTVQLTGGAMWLVFVPQTNPCPADQTPIYPGQPPGTFKSPNV